MSIRESREDIDLKNFLAGFLPNFLPDNVVSQMLSKDAFKIFKKAFTHSSKNKDSHYDALETLGDACITPCFYTYIMRKHKVNTAGEMSTLKSYFLAKNVFADFSDKFGFTKHIQILEPLTVDHKEDVFESFNGALRYVGDYYIGKYTGQMFVNMFVDWVFDQVNIDTRNIKQYLDPISYLKENYFDYHGTKGKKLNMEFKNENDKQKGMWISKVIHPDPIKGDKVLGIGMARDEKEAKREAARDAIKKLNI